MGFFLIQALLIIPAHVFRIELSTFLDRYIVQFSFLSFINNDIFYLYMLHVLHVLPEDDRILMPKHVGLTFVCELLQYF